MRTNFMILLILISGFSINAQKLDIGLYIGRFYSIYQYKDYGTGFRNVPASQYSVFPSIVLNKKYSASVSAELRGSFMVYQQYIGTRLYRPNFFSVINGGNISFTTNYSILHSSKIECRMKGGIGIGLVPNMYEGEFIEIFSFPVFDSISRGNIKRNFTPIFPTLSLGVDISYKIAKRFKLSIAANYQKGFLRITEYDIYYNDGRGSNDQRAKQWGTGDFYGVQLGLRYSLKDENGEKFKKNK